MDRFGTHQIQRDPAGNGAVSIVVGTVHFRSVCGASIHVDCIKLIRDPNAFRVVVRRTWQFVYKFPTGVQNWLNLFVWTAVLVLPLVR